VIPSSEIIHDRMLTLWHPLVGVSPIYACGSSATQGIRIQSNSELFFRNMSRPGGILTIPREMPDDKLEDLKQEWNVRYSGEGLGKTAILAGVPKDGVMPAYTPITIPAHDAQLIEQLKWTVEDVCRVFHVPLHKVGASNPTFNNISSLNEDYYQQCLQTLIESVEVLLDEGLSMPADMGTELDLEGLLRMDPIGMAEVNERSIRAGYLSPNEARARANLGPVQGGATPYLQQQNFSLAALDKRDSAEAPAGLTPTQAPPPPAEDDEQDAEARALADALIRKFAGHGQPA